METIYRLLTKAWFLVIVFGLFMFVILHAAPVLILIILVSFVTLYLKKIYDRYKLRSKIRRLYLLIYNGY
jgi:hypothetical protein